jgi:hypothetical protein
MEHETTYEWHIKRNKFKTPKFQQHGHSMHVTKSYQITWSDIKNIVLICFYTIT